MKSSLKHIQSKVFFLYYASFSADIFFIKFNIIASVVKPLNLSIILQISTNNITWTSLTHCLLIIQYLIIYCYNIEETDIVKGLVLGESSRNLVP